MRPGEDELGGQEGTDPGLVEQLRREGLDELLDLAGELAFFCAELPDAACDALDARAGCRGARGHACDRGARRSDARADEQD